jgi:hypothetical protein
MERKYEMVQEVEVTKWDCNMPMQQGKGFFRFAIPQ